VGCLGSWCPEGANGAIRAFPEGARGVQAMLWLALCLENSFSARPEGPRALFGGLSGRPRRWALSERAGPFEATSPWRA